MSAVTTMRHDASEFGQQLKEERERQSLPLEQVAMSIKVREQYLDAIERHDWDALPEPVFTRSYIQSYAEFLHMDPNRALNAYARAMRIARASQPVNEEAEVEAAKVLLERLARTQGLDPGGSWWRNRWIVLAVITVCAGAAALWLAFSLPSALPIARAPSVARENSPSAATSSQGSVTTPTDSVDDLRTDSRPPPSETTAPVDTSQSDHTARVETDDAEQATAPTTDGPSRTIEAAAPTPALTTTRQAPVHSEPAEHTVPLTVPRSAPVHSEPTAALPATSPLPPAGAMPEHAGRLAIPEFGVGTGIMGRQLVGRSDHFAEGTVVWFWTRVLDGRRGDTIRHVWLHEGRVMGTVRLSVGGSQWRTQSQWQLGKGSSGSWAVEARDADDRVLATMTFLCGSAATSN